MLRTVAIVEDSQEEAEMLRDYFQKYSAENGAHFNISGFGSGEQFLDKYQPIYDIVLMDIGLPDIDGMETAVRLRELDKTTTIIFVTNMAQFAVRGYEVGAFDFIVKPVSYSNFSLKLRRVLNNINNRRDQELVITNSDGIFRMASSQIKYIEISGHKITYHTTCGLIEAYGNLKEVEANLNDKMFVRCNNCYLVNLNYVQAVRGYLAIVDGEQLQMSRPRRKLFIQALNDYLGGGI